MKAIHDMGGMAEVGSDRRSVGLGAVGYDDLDALEPAIALRDQKALQGLGAAVLDDPQRLARLGVQQHRDIAVPPPQAGLVHQQDATALLAALGCDALRPVLDQRHDGRPREAVASCDLGDRQLAGVSHHGARQAPCHLALEGGVILQMTFTAVAAREPSPQPDQGRLGAEHGEVRDPDPADIVHLGRLEAAPRALQHRAQVLHAYLEPLGLV